MKKLKIVQLISLISICILGSALFNPINNTASLNNALIPKNILKEENSVASQLINYLNITSNLKASNEDSEVLYLSDIPYKTGQTAWKEITYDKTYDNKDLSLKIENSYVPIKKGIWAHATSTIIYDLSNYNYDYFTAYLGLNSSASKNSNGVKFYIYTSNDEVNWDLKTQENPTVIKPGDNAQFVKINIKGAKYLKLYVNDNGGNGSDHSVYGDAKVIKDGYSDNVTKSVSEYDELIRSKYNGQMTDEIELLILQRNLIKNFGQYQLKLYFDKGEEYKQTFNLIFNDLELLRLYTAGGNPDGNYQQSFTVLHDLYKAYKSDLTNNKTTSNGTKYSDIYKKMMISLSLTHSQEVAFWIRSTPANDKNINPNISVATTRYAIYKELLLDGKLDDVFLQLEVEEMRYIMNSFINDDEIKWANAYAKSKSNHLSGYAYMNYKNVNTTLYRSEQFYGDNEKLKDYITKYKLAGYNVKNVAYYPRLWMIMEIGGVCWQISNVGQNMVASLGIPATTVGQPGHTAYYVYSLDKKGRGIWNLWNDVGGWTSTNTSSYTGHKSYYTVRLLNNWGGGSYASSNKGSYILLGQAALNDYNSYVKAEEKVLLANSYTNDLDKQKELYREALEIQSINLDAWLGLINAYKNDSNTTQTEYYELAKQLADNLKYYPLPMVDLLKQINSKITSPAYMASMTILQNKYLTLASVATDKEVVQSNITRLMAKYLLGIVDTEVAKFSFDGDKGGIISLASRYENSQANWDYSLDGGITWQDVDTHSVKLTKEEINSITAEKDIKVHIIGTNYEEENIYTIDIKNGTLPNLYGNDLENSVIGTNNSFEWRYTNNDDWTSYKESTPNLNGDKTVEVRQAATGIYLPSNSSTFTFTKDNQPDTRKYIPIKHLSVHEYSSEAADHNEKAIYVIDGNIYTMWHSNWVGDNQRYITIKLDEAKYISALELIPRADAANGRPKDGKLLVSMDGISWTEVATFSNWLNNSSTKVINIQESVKAQYVKFQATSNHGSGNFISALIINLFEDTTGERPRAQIEYSTTNATTKSVSAKIVKPSTDITITNNGGKDTYTFTENGEFTFEFVDKEGRKGSTTAKVDWIMDYNFSFDGSDAGKIILSDKYACDDLLWEFSLDGGKTYKQVNKLEYQLTDDEINSINSSNDIKIRFIKVTTTTGEFNIDIKDNISLPNNLYGNDLENAIMASNDDMEWIRDTDSTWTSFAKQKPDLTGDSIVKVRLKGKGLTLPSPSKTFTFTKDSNDKKKVYIPIKYLSVESFSSENVRPRYNQNEPAIYAIDGNINNIWHSSRTVGNYADERYITIKLSEPKYISHIQYVGKPNYNYGVLQDATISVSLDNERWEDVVNYKGGKVNSLDELKNKYVQEIEFDDSYYAQYVRIKCTESHDYLFGTDNTTGKPKNYFINAAMINLFEDTTKEDKKTIVEIKYDKHSPTNQNVIAQIVSPNSKITTLNNNGSDKYEFKNNGEFTFKYIDEYGVKGEITAHVTWIDRTAPTAELVFSETKPTQKDISVVIVFSEDIIIEDDIELLDDVSGHKILTIKHNGLTNLHIRDLAGNKAIIPINVTWIDREAPSATASYSPNKITNKDVIVTLDFNEKTILDCEDFKIVKNSDTSYSLTITNNVSHSVNYEDEAGNKGSIPIKVDWIDKEVPTATILYNITSETNKSVVATLKPSEKVTITNNNGSDTYTFDKNGEFIFTFKDEAGNTGSAKANVTWIKKDIPNLKITYNITEPTEENVVATLELTGGIKVTNNNGKNTYTFTKNGEFTFEYVDKYGNTGSSTARVNWITETKLEVKIKYDITTTTAGKVIATIISNKPITITNNDGKTIYTFTNNGEFTFNYIDENGKTGSITAKVDWIDESSPTAEIEYSTKEFTNKDVIVKLINPNRKITITNNNGSDTYVFTKNGEFIFEYIDENGRKGSTKAVVNWIDKTAIISSIHYNKTTKTNKNVKAILQTNKDVKILNNGGKNTYTFTKNGEFTFEFIDKYGNTGKAKARVTWINKTSNNSNSNKNNISNNSSHKNSNSNSNKNSNFNSNSNSNIIKSNNNSSSNIIKESNNNINNLEKKKSNKGLTIIIAGILLLIICLIAVKIQKELNR